MTYRLITQAQAIIQAAIDYVDVERPEVVAWQAANAIVEAGWRPESGELASAAYELLMLKGGPRDEEYYSRKRGAWERLRHALQEVDRTPQRQDVMEPCVCPYGINGAMAIRIGTASDCTQHGEPSDG